jgi:D-psicose/D-tagatose/L-ribulose 3-epimerase
MRFSFLFYDTAANSAELADRMRRVADLGFHGIELSASHPGGHSADETAELSERFHLPVASLLSGWSYDHEGLCLASPDANIRRRASERLVDYVDLAARLTSVLVVGLMQGRRSDEPDGAVANDRIAAALTPVARAAEARGVTVALEPVNHLQVGFNNTIAEADALAARIHSPALGFMLDTFHMHIEERSVVGAIRASGGRCRHFHLCETNGGPFGTGALDFPAVLAALSESGYQGWVSTKVYRGATWEEAAASCATFLSRLGVGFGAA